MEYRILIVSEEATDRNRYAEALISGPHLAGCSYQITTVGSFAAAQLRATRQRFDLVIVALSQQEDGLELSSRLKDLYPDMRLLLVCEQGVTKSQLKTARVIRANVAESTIDSDSFRAIVSDMLGTNALPQGLPDTSNNRPAPQQASPHCKYEPAPQSSILQPFLQPFLEELRRQTRANVAVYTDRHGRIIGRDGEDTGLDIAETAVLVSGSGMGSSELRRVLKDPKTTHLSVHEGKQYDIYATNVGDERFLLLFFNKEYTNPKMGFVWLMMKRSAEQFNRINNSGNESASTSNGSTS